MSLREKAYQSFTAHLLARRIQPGQFVSQRELVELTGMPLGAIREMIPRLEAEGLIATVPHRGLQIAHVDVNLIRNAFQLRGIVEREAIAHFAATVTDDEIAALLEAHRAARNAAVGGVTEEILANAQKLDWDFHDRMVDSLDNTLISAIYRTNSIRIRLIRNDDTRMLPELVVSVMDEHLAILDALAAHDASAAVHALDAHLDSAKRRAVRL